MIARTAPTTLPRGPVRYTQVYTTQFERVAEKVVERVAELLCAPVSVLDERGATIAHGLPGGIVPLRNPLEPPAAAHLRVPLRPLPRRPGNRGVRGNLG